MKIALLALVATAGIAQADIITQWNFNLAGGGSSTGTLTPNLGVGTASNVGGTSSAFNSGDANGGSTDPVVAVPPAPTEDSGWQVSAFAAQGANSDGTGVQFLVSTVGFTDIIVTFDQRHSNTSSRFYAGQYTVDGGANWITATTFEGTAGDTWFNNRTIDLSAVTAADNNPSFGVRVVATFAPGTSTYFGTTANTAAGYAATGTARFDMVTVNGVIPTPGALALAGIGGLLAARRRRD
jgi:uncharacterized protein